MPELDLVTGILAAIVTITSQEIIRRLFRLKKSPTIPPPPDAEHCKRCFFFDEYKRMTGNEHSDSQIIRLLKKIKPK